MSYPVMSQSMHNVHNDICTGIKNIMMSQHSNIKVAQEQQSQMSQYNNHSHGISQYKDNAQSNVTKYK